MASKTFKVSGAYSHKGHSFNFSKKVSGENEDAVKEKAYCLLGSNHKIKRGEITLESIEIVKSEKALVSKTVVPKEALKIEVKEEKPAAQEAAEPEPETLQSGQ